MTLSTKKFKKSFNNFIRRFFKCYYVDSNTPFGASAKMRSVIKLHRGEVYHIVAMKRKGKLYRYKFYKKIL